MKRTHYATEIGVDQVGLEVILNGWVNTRRDHGGLIFIDLRDRSGLIQVVLSPEVDLTAFRIAEQVRGEHVLAVKGIVCRRPADTENPNLKTGLIEVSVSTLSVLNKAKTPPFYIEDGIEVDENLRLKYRYLDLRRPEMMENILLRHRVIKDIRDFLDQRGFIEVETPVLTSSTPEGARDYLVPSRVHPGRFYGLPQSPQIFKQMLMVAGFDKYFQIARCFRDEDLRADRQPEFTQLDIELSFIDEEDIFSLVEELMAELFRLIDRPIKVPFPRIRYDEAMARYGSDAPDLRYGLNIIDLTEILKGAEFKVFSATIANGGVVRAINARGCAAWPRREIDELGKMAVENGARGMAWIACMQGELKSPITKFLSQTETDGILAALDAKDGDLLLFGADMVPVVNRVLGFLRQELARRLGLLNTKELNFAWIYDFPLLEYDDEEKRYVAVHHMFTSPREEDIDLLKSDPLGVRARAYDLVLNGTEIGGGSIRIHRRDWQEAMFKRVGMDAAEAMEKFGYMLEAFEYGTPPHGGIAFGIDRLLMIMAGRSSIRDVIAFPKTQSAACPLTGAPSKVSAQQLRELSLRLKGK